MAKYVIQSKRGEPPQGAYSQGWRAGDFIFLPGTGPVDPLTGKIVGDTIEQQTEKTIDNIAATLEADGASLSDIVKVTTHLSDPTHFKCYNVVYARRFSPPYPVRTTVGSSLAMSPGMMIEIDCIAYKPQPAADGRSRAARKNAPLKKVVVTSAYPGDWEKERYTRTNLCTLLVTSVCLCSSLAWLHFGNDHD